MCHHSIHCNCRLGRTLYSKNAASIWWKASLGDTPVHQQHCITSCLKLNMQPAPGRISLPPFPFLIPRKRQQNKTIIALCHWGTFCVVSGCFRVWHQWLVESRKKSSRGRVTLALTAKRLCVFMPLTLHILIDMLISHQLLPSLIFKPRIRN